MLSVPRMRILLELRRHGTLAEVAHILNYTPSAVSQQLSALEAETKVTLTQRVGRGLKLTQQGEILATHAEIVIAQLEQAQADLAASLGEVSGRIRIACFQSVMLALIPDTLTLLNQRFPALHIEVTQYDEPDAVDGLLSHEYDLILGEEYPGQPIRGSAGIEWDLLTVDPMRAALPMSGPWSDPRAVLAGLATAPWVLEDETSAFGRWAIALMQGQGFSPHIPFLSTDILLHLHLVETGHAVALVPDLLWLSQTPRVQLVPLPGNPHRRLLTGVRAGASDHPRIVALREALRDVTDALQQQ